MPKKFTASTAKSSDCLRDHFLLAMPCLSEGLFSHSITYICEHGESGAMGIVINSPWIFQWMKYSSTCKSTPDRISPICR